MTGWFRMRRVFPLIAAHLRDLGGDPVVWSAACGTGEEPYSLAIMLEREGLASRVLASDVDPDLVRFARRARYSDESVADTEDDDLPRWLVPYGDRWRPGRAVRERVMFTVAELGVDGPPEGCAVVFARNVWRYLTAAGQDRAAAQIADTIGPAGRLVLGGADIFDAQLRDAVPDAIRTRFRQTAEHSAIWQPA
ncbi:hypothetical protein BVU76_21685 [Mycolicibacterium porcinum]|nr:hypothetical protein BVU76_21685 [Mycolicibacterium porcinum]